MGLYKLQTQLFEILSMKAVWYATIHSLLYPVALKSYKALIQVLVKITFHLRLDTASVHEV